MRFGATVVLASALLVSLAAQAQAQPGGGRGPGGRGGFGFGGPGGGGGVAGLLMMQEVQKEIGATEEQMGKFREAAQAAGGRGPGGPGGERPNFREMSDDERAKFMEDMRKQAEERAKKMDETVKSVFDAKQVARLEELRLQREGAQALGREDIAAKLKLTGEQKEKIKEALASGQVDFRAGRGPGGRGEGGQGGFDREAFQKQMEEARAKREKAQADALAVLTADQKSQFDTMQGAKFEFPQFGGFGGGRGPGGPGGPGGGRPGRPPAGND